MEEDNFAKARFESIRKKNYSVKSSKNDAKKNFIDLYLSNPNKQTRELKKLTFKYMISKRGIVMYDIKDEDFLHITEEEIQNVYEEIKAQSSSNFIYFYQSYIRKIEKGYSKEYISNSLNDLKTAYYTYRKFNNLLWNGTHGQITEYEMTNLYNVLNNVKKISNEVNSKETK